MYILSSMLVAAACLFSQAFNGNGSTDLPLIITSAQQGKGSQELADQMYHTQELVYICSNGNTNVMHASMIFLRNLYAVYSMGEGLIEKDLFRILDALQFAAQKHQFQTRSDPQQTPYIIHPIGVANHLLMTGFVRDPDIIIGGLLHDTVEDTDTSLEEIQAAFGARVEGFVQEVTDDKSLPKMERKRLQIVHAPGKSAGAAQIKLADKWYNLNNLETDPPPEWNIERIDAYFLWAKQVVDALPWVNHALKNAVDQVITTHLLRCS